MSRATAVARCVSAPSGEAAMATARQLHLFKSRRQKGSAPPAPSEYQLHVAVADMLRRWINPGWKWSHFPAGEERPAQIINGKRVSFAGARLKKMGLNRGFPDFMFFHADGRVCFLELKRPGETLDDEQDEIARHLIRAGHGYLWTASFDDAIATLVDWRALRSGIHV
jgi:hypothetical protein